MDKRVAERKSQFDIAQGKKSEVEVKSVEYSGAKSEPVAIPASQEERRAKMEEALKIRKEKRKTKA